MFSCRLYGIFKNAFFTEHLRWLLFYCFITCFNLLHSFLCLNIENYFYKWERLTFPLIFKSDKTFSESWYCHNDKSKIMNVFFVLFFYIWMLYIRLAHRGWGRQGLACLFLKIEKKCPYIRKDRPDCIHLLVKRLIWKAILEATGKNKIQNFSHGVYRSALIPRHLTCPEKVLVAHLYVVAFSCLMISTFSYILSIHEKSIFKNFAKFTGKHLSRSIKMRYLLKVWWNLQQLTWTALS